ncbi:MAG: aldolase [Bradyrhizobium sp.]|nr:aldolase [Bradyrhizobium sp.]MDB5602063.1 aldolase [Xanthobacteraceae bacterium]
MNRDDPAAFRKRLAAGDRLSGTFIKTPTGHAIEIFGDLAYDFVVIDEEHAPFGREAIDHALVSARAARISALVRVASAAPSNLLSVLDGGAVGVLVPHVASPERAREIVASCRYRGGKRGFSNSPRAGRYGGLSLGEHVAHGDAVTTIVAQIEDPEALDCIDKIVRTDGVDALFIGRGDLAVSMGAKAPDAPEVRAAAEYVCAAARAAGKPVMVFVGNADDARAMRAIGASAFIFSSDQGLMRQAAVRTLAEFQSLD